jgi:hypothetical protein
MFGGVALPARRSPAVRNRNDPPVVIPPHQPEKESNMNQTTSQPPPSEIHRPEFIASFLRRQANLKHFLVVWQEGREIINQILPDPDVMAGVLREANQRLGRGPTRAASQTGPLPEHVQRLCGQLRTCIRDLTLGGTEFLLCSKVEDQPAEYAYEIHTSRGSARADIAELNERVIQGRLAEFREQLARAAKEEAGDPTGHPMDEPFSNPESAAKTVKAENADHRRAGRKRSGKGRLKRRQAAK